MSLQAAATFRRRDDVEALSSSALPARRGRAVAMDFLGPLNTICLFVIAAPADTGEGLGVRGRTFSSFKTKLWPSFRAWRCSCANGAGTPLPALPSSLSLSSSW